jgi:phage terminase large subunit
VKTFRTTTLEAYEHGVVREGYIDELGYVPGSDMWKQEVEAEFLSWSGLVFDKYNRIRHSPDPFTHQPFSRVYGGVDVGYGSYTALELIGITPAGKMYVFAEYYQKRATPHEWMRVAAEWTKEHKVARWYVDSAADQELRAMKSAGLPAYPSIKAKDAAGTAVGYINGKFMNDELSIDAAACPYLVSEMEAYQYKELLTGDEVTFLDKVKPNQADHAIDAFRYGLFSLSAHTARQNYGKVVEFLMNGGDRA